MALESSPGLGLTTFLFQITVGACGLGARSRPDQGLGAMIRHPEPSHSSSCRSACTQMSDPCR